MAIRNIIQKAEQEFPPAIKQELDPIAIAELALLSGYINTVDSNLATTGSTLNIKIDNLSGYSNNTFYTKNNPSGFITKENVVFQTGDQTISGTKTFIQDTNFSGILNFDINNTGEVLDGQMSWNRDYGTIQLGMNGGDVVNLIGFKSFYRVKAAETIRKGKVVMALGGVGNSEYILAKEAQNIGNSGQLIMGVSAEQIATNEYGDVVAFGAVRGINTNDYPVDSILYFDTASTGEFTNIPPEAPNPKVIVALNTTSANNGIIFVRVGSDTSNFYTNDNPSGFITSENVLFTTGTQTISGDKTFQAESYIFSGADVTITGSSTFAIDTANTTTNGIVKNFGGASGMQVITTGEYNSITPVSGVVYILI